jgi:RNA polymerase sigma factor, sigma-70 family
MEDKAIVELVWNRKEKGIEDMSAKYEKYCFAISCRIVNNKEDAEECVNDTWFSAWNSIPPHRPVNLAGYLAKIVRNISINRYNKKNAAKRGDGSMAVALDELSECVAGRGRVEDNLEMELVTEVISDYLDSQDQTRRWIFLQRYFYLADIKEIAGRLDMKEGTVKSVLCRMRRQLRDYLEMEDVM